MTAEDKKSNNYRKYCRPELAETLSAIGLDKIYHRAEGVYMWYFDDNGEEIQVIDFVGGYGSAICGHNHPELISIITDAYKNKLPFCGQLSNRSKAGLLGKKLNNIFEQITGSEYLTIQANSGAEAVEATIKHASLYKLRKIEQQAANIKRDLYRERENVIIGEAEITEQFSKLLNKRMKINSTLTIADAIKAIKLFNNEAIKIKPYLISLKGAFHGKTSGAIKLTYNKSYRSAYDKVGPEVIFVEAGDKEQLDSAIEKSKCTLLIPKINKDNQVILEEFSLPNITAFFIEPIQGESGIHVVPKEYLEYCRKQADSYNFPLVFDEIQCGMGRTGTFLYSEQAGVFADYYLLSKSLGGGLSKISTISFKKKLNLPEFDLIHSSTFAEDDISSLVAIKTLDIMQGKSASKKECRIKGEFILSELHKLKDRYPSVITEVRGVGLMIGLEFSENRSSSNGINELISQDMLGYVISGHLLNEYGVRVAPTLSSGTTIRLEPSFLISELDCVRLLSGLSRVCEILQKQNMYELTKYIIGKTENNAFNSPIKDYSSARKRYKKPADAIKVFFIGHLVKASDMKLWDSSYEAFTEIEIEDYLNRTYKLFGPVLSSEHTVESITGDIISLNFVGLFLDAKIINRHMANRDRALIHDKIQTAVDIAVNNGAAVIGFGGYTSIVTNNCRNIISDSVALTSGNSLTVGMGIEAIYKSSIEKGVDLEKSTFAAVGAAGNIASVYSEMIAERVPKIILIGREKSEKRLIKVANSIYKNTIDDLFKKQAFDGGLGDKKELKGIAGQIVNLGVIQALLRYKLELRSLPDDLNIYEQIQYEIGDKSPIVISTDLNDIKDADVILSASNTAEPFIFPNMLKKSGAIICDIAVPADVDSSVIRERSDVNVIKGGLVKLPYNPEFYIKGLPLEKGESYACMAETMLLGLMRVTSNYSYGSITKMQVKKISAIAKMHKFKLVKPKIEDSY